MKVYCKNCRYYKDFAYRYRCYYPVYCEDYLGPREVSHPYEMHVQNEENDCKFYIKRTFWDNFRCLP